MDDQPHQPVRDDFDAAASLDRIVEAGWTVPHQCETDAERARCAHICRVLGLLDAGLDEMVRDHRDVRIDATVARVVAARAAAGDSVGVVGASAIPTALSSADGRDLDALVERGWDSAGDTGAERLVALLGAGEAFDAASRESLIERTLARVASEEERERNRFRLQPSDDRMVAPRRIRLSDFGAIAAMVLIGVGILWPVVTGMRAENQRISDASNMQAAGLGFGMFANDHRDHVPFYSKRDPKGVWWRVGDPPRSHSANLFALVREGYASVGELASPGNPDAPTAAWDPEAEDWRQWQEVSYSYQLFGDEVPRLSSEAGSARLVLTDRSPVIDQARRGEAIDPLRGSPNTRGWGQHLLFSDGEVRFSRSPVLPNGDNVWLPRQFEDRAARLTGTELPQDQSDAFVGP